MSQLPPEGYSSSYSSGDSSASQSSNSADGTGGCFELQRGCAVLERTPRLLGLWLRDLPAEWVLRNEGGESWSPFDVVGHLIHGDRTDWIQRARRILDEGPSTPFDPFDRYAQFDASRGKELSTLLDEFRDLREQNLATLAGWSLTPEQLLLEGTHPAFGRVTLGQLLATWVAHDLGHIAQIARVMARQYTSDVGPWVEYLPILQRR